MGITMLYFKNTNKRVIEESITRHDDQVGLAVMKSELDPDLTGTAEVEKHSFSQISGGTLNICSGNVQLIDGEPLEENEPYELFFIFEYKEVPQYFQICMASHIHQHTVILSVISGECNLYITAKHRFPTKVSWDWRVDHRLSDSISIHTYADDYRSANEGGLVVGVVSDIDSSSCEIGYRVDTFSNAELVHKLGLRGGKVIMAKDLDPLLLEME